MTNSEFCDFIEDGRRGALVEVNPERGVYGGHE
jgi:hypothetical protein